MPIKQGREKGSTQRVQKKMPLYKFFQMNERVVIMKEWASESKTEITL